ncbi:MAG: MoaD/ThiS family protein [Anaerolineae bacterium]
MKVTVRFGAPLSQVVGENKLILSMPEGARVADVLSELKARYPDFEEGLKGKGLRWPLDQIMYSLFLNDRPVPLEKAPKTLLKDGDRLSFFLPVAGG